MVKIKIPKELPECDLFSVLAEKVEQRKDIDFNFFGRLDEFRQRVSSSDQCALSRIYPSR